MPLASGPSVDLPLVSALDFNSSMNWGKDVNDIYNDIKIVGWWYQEGNNNYMYVTSLLRWLLYIWKIKWKTENRSVKMRSNLHIHTHYEHEAQVIWDDANSSLFEHLEVEIKKKC